MKRREKRGYVLSRVFFLDLLVDRRTRPIFIYAFCIVWIGAALYHWLEGWSWLDSFYFVVITLTTIGYGDLHPTIPATKIITIFYGLNGIVLILMLFDVIRTVRGWDISQSPKSTEKSYDEEG
jgi:voltage-gated potassium channel